MDIEKIFKEYENCLYYNEQRLALAKNKDMRSVVDMGTDFARLGMMEFAVWCWQYVIDLGNGTSEAYSNLGVSYYYGNGVQQNYKKAVNYYQRAAALGHPFGMYNLAVACEYGNGTPKDIKKAIEFYCKSAERGVNQAIDALIRLGIYDEVKGLAFYPRNLDDNSFNGNF